MRHLVLGIGPRLNGHRRESLLVLWNKLGFRKMKVKRKEKTDRGSMQGFEGGNVGGQG